MSTGPIQMTLSELIGSRKEVPSQPVVPAEPRPKLKRVVSPLTNEHVGYCKNCGTVSFCLIEESCAVCDKRQSKGVAILRESVECLGKAVAWIESLGPTASWSVDEQREPMHVKYTANALLRVLQGILDRETP